MRVPSRRQEVEGGRVQGVATGSREGGVIQGAYSNDAKTVGFGEESARRVGTMSTVGSGATPGKPACRGHQDPRRAAGATHVRTVPSSEADAMSQGFVGCQATALQHPAWPGRLCSNSPERRDQT